MEYIGELSSNVLTVPPAEKKLRLKNIWQFFPVRQSVNSCPSWVLFSLLISMISLYKICRKKSPGK